MVNCTYMLLILYALYSFSCTNT
uniref:Uncharacterized protein n=1 Tax=Arundo donax TaxID=35708 RepID=A0A0A8Z5W7_ARUDO